MAGEKLFFDPAILRKRRQDAGMTLEALAEKMGTSKQWVAIMETGIFGPNMRSLEKFGRALGFETVVDLLKED